MNALERVAAGAAATLKRIGGVQIVYRRGGFTVPLTAVRTVAEYRVLDAKGLPVRARYTDWLFVASEIVIDGRQVKPQPGDQIEAAGKTHQVTSLDTKRGCFEPHDSAGHMINVHSVEV